ncbi:MAG: methyl-accepting chemotaxis protein [Planctomycetes bacterium]|nr:methyl-accepting chemotaxis protein [Planctomycetota bacterium]
MSTLARLLPIEWLRARATVRLRLALLLGMAIAVTAWLGTMLLGTTHGINGAFQTMAREQLPASSQLGLLRQSFLRAVVAERSLMFQSMSTPSAKALVAEHQESVDAARAAWQELQRLVPGAVAGATFEGTFAEWEKTTKEVVEILAEDTPAARRDAIDLSMSAGQDAALAVRTSLDEVSDKCTASVTAAASEAGAAAAAADSSFTYYLGVSIAVLVLFGFVIITSVVGPLVRVQRAMAQVAGGGGDLTKRLSTHGGGEITALAKAFNQFLDGLAEMVQKIRATASEVSTAAEQVDVVSNGLANNSSTLSQRVDAAGNAANRVREITDVAAGSTTQLSASIREIAENSQRSAETSSAGVRLVESTWNEVDAMGKESGEIRRMLDVIETIARQTNLLALNASVEAARAGDAGAGFAVVAERVKTLAIETSKATTEIGDRVDKFLSRVDNSVRSISEIKQVISNIEMATNSNASAVEEQSAVTQDFADSFTQISQSSGSIASELDSLAQVAESSREDASSARSSAAALTQSAQRLDELVGQFRV